MRIVLALAALVALSGPAFARSSMSSSAMKAMPTCKAGDSVVWVNTRSKVFYEPGASYYGKTKHGKFACESMATSMGMHAAKNGMMMDSNGASMKGHQMHGSANDSMETGSASSGAMDSGAMHDGASGHSRRGSRVTPAPIATASPSN